MNDKKELPTVLIKDLKKMLNETDRYDNEPVQVLLNIPSIGGHAVSEVSHAHFGFDWDRGLLLSTKDKITRKEKKQDIFEKATDLLMTLATEWYVMKKENFVNRRAREILLKFGYTDEKMRAYVRLFHKDKPIIK